jgi:hypothetical protein
MLLHLQLPKPAAVTEGSWRDEHSVTAGHRNKRGPRCKAGCEAVEAGVIALNESCSLSGASRVALGQYKTVRKYIDTSQSYGSSKRRWHRGSPAYAEPPLGTWTWRP